MSMECLTTLVHPRSHSPREITDEYFVRSLCSSRLMGGEMDGSTSSIILVMISSSSSSFVAVGLASSVRTLAVTKGKRGEMTVPASMVTLLLVVLSLSLIHI